MSEQQVAVGFVVIRSRSFGQKRNESVFRVKPIYSFDKFAEKLDLNSVTESVEGVFPNYLHPAFKQSLEHAMNVFAQAEAKARAASAAARKAEQERILAENAQQERQARQQHFLRLADDSKARVKFDPETMWRTRDRNLASSIAAKGVLEFIGPSDDYSFAFSDPEHIGDQICKRCLQKSLKRSAPNSGGVVMVTCSNPECHYHDYESGEMPEWPRSALHGRVQLVG